LTISDPAGNSDAHDDESGRWLQAIAAGLSAADLSIQLEHSNAGLYLTAALRSPARREVDIVIDEDGYTELRYWTDPAAIPAQVANTIVRALAVVDVICLRDRAIEKITSYDGAVTERAGDGVMPGPQDRLADQQTNPDQVRPHPPDHVNLELVKRMERLPPGHPSSPYNADGTRKPSVPDTTSSELPIPGDPGFKADELVSVKSSSSGLDGHEGGVSPASDSGIPRDSPSDDKPWIGSDGSWAWRGRQLTPERSRIADQAAERCREAEGRDADGNYGERGLTPAMHRIDSQLESGHLVDGTEEYALKGPDRFKEKLAKMILDEPDADPRELVSRIIDGVRYTFEFADEKYYDGVLETCGSLSSAGFEMYERKNAWADETKSYKGINSTWMDHRNGMLFEVQMHTPASWTAKQESHGQYEIIESLSSTSEEKAKARERQDQIFARVALPDGATTIPSYRMEDW
jgi:hypothetical protein